MAKNDDDAFSTLLENPWGSLIFGLLVIGIAVSLHHTFTELETGVRESERLNWIVAVVYNLLGHWPAVGLVAAMGGFLAVSGIRKMTAS